jgi:RsiW-degrading membrane proteinase PrsW (M82 family)
MEKVFILAISISVLFLLGKVIEMKYVEKKAKPLKFLIRDTVMVFLCSFLPLLLFFQFDTKINEIFQLGDEPKVTSQIFTDEPGF